MELGKYYRKQILYSSACALLLTLIFSVIDNRNYKSEWLTAGSVIFVSFVSSLFYCFIIGILSTSIFLVNLQKVKRNKLLIIISWFLPTIIFIMIVVAHEIWFSLRYETEVNFIYLILLNFPFIIGLIWAYFGYKKLTTHK